MTKKCAILTITDGTNYGNRLQNYALQQVLLSLGFDVETIKRKNYHDHQRIKKNIKFAIKKLIRMPVYDKCQRKRTERFKKFNCTYIKFSKYILGYNHAPKGLNEHYDYFVCGSDQIWNANFKIIKEDILNYLAIFAEKKKKIAYAASFGTNSINDNYRKNFEEYLPTFKDIGVREASGVNIIKELTGREDIHLVLDPTLLLSFDEWNALAKKPKFIDEKPFVLSYFLGGRTEIIKSRIDEISKKYGCISINMDKENLRDNKIDDIDVYSASPDEFVWLIKNAECILTDSFHACAFSIIFHKKFIPFQRKTPESNNNMSGRLTTLFEAMGLDQEIDSLEMPSLLPLEHDYMQVDVNLEQARKKSLDFLRNALDV